MIASLADVAGWAGAGSLLLGYLLLSHGRIRAGVAFQALNLAGSVGLGANSAYHRAWPSVALNAVWFGIGLVALRALRRAPDPADR